MLNPGRKRAILRTLWLLGALVVWRLGLALLVAALSVGFFLLILWNLPVLTAWDERVMAFFKGRSDLESLAALLSWPANGLGIVIVVTASVLALGWRRRWWPQAAMILIGTLGGWGVIEIIKRTTQRPRPETDLHTVGYSFPSGHAFFALVIYGMLAFWLAETMPHRKARIYVAAAIFILLVGCSRFLLGVHYPTDVFGGFAAAIPWLWGCLAIPQIVRRGFWRSWSEGRLSEFRWARSFMASLRMEKSHLRDLEQSVLETVPWPLAPVIRAKLVAADIVGFLMRPWLPEARGALHAAALLPAASACSRCSEEDRKLLAELRRAARCLFGLETPERPLIAEIDASGSASYASAPPQPRPSASGERRIS